MAVGHTDRLGADRYNQRLGEESLTDRAAIPPHEQTPCVGRAFVRDPVGRTPRPLRMFNERQEIEMNWDQVEGNWKQLKGNVKEQWGKLTDDQLDVIAGKRDQLAGKIQEAYGVSKEDAEQQLSDWEKRQR